LETNAPVEIRSLSQGRELYPAYPAGGPAGELAIISLYTKYCSAVTLHIKGWKAVHGNCKSEPQDILHDAFIIMIHKIQSEGFCF
jgi:hypothetical protein